LITELFNDYLNKLNSFYTSLIQELQKHKIVFNMNKYDDPLTFFSILSSNLSKSNMNICLNKEQVKNLKDTLTTEKSIVLSYLSHPNCFFNSYQMIDELESIDSKNGEINFSSDFLSQSIKQLISSLKSFSDKETNDLLKNVTFSSLLFYNDKLKKLQKTSVLITENGNIDKCYFYFNDKKARIESFLQKSIVIVALDYNSLPNNYEIETCNSELIFDQENSSSLPQINNTNEEVILSNNLSEYFLYRVKMLIGIPLLMLGDFSKYAQSYYQLNTQDRSELHSTAPTNLPYSKTISFSNRHIFYLSMMIVSFLFLIFLFFPIPGLTILNNAATFSIFTKFGWDSFLFIEMTLYLLMAYVLSIIIVYYIFKSYYSLLDRQKKEEYSYLISFLKIYRYYFKPIDYFIVLIGYLITTTLFIFIQFASVNIFFLTIILVLLIALMYSYNVVVIYHDIDDKYDQSTDIYKPPYVFEQDKYLKQNYSWKFMTLGSSIFNDKNDFNFTIKEFLISNKLYQHFKNKKRIILTSKEDFKKWKEYPINISPEIEFLSKCISKINSENKFSELEAVSNMLSFVQDSIPYSTDTESTGFDEYPRYPIETVYDKTGDCECKSILLASIISLTGIETALISFSNHCALGLKITDTQLLKMLEVGDNLIEYENNKYLYCESTSYGWRIGKIPSKYNINTDIESLVQIKLDEMMITNEEMEIFPVIIT